MQSSEPIAPIPSAWGYYATLGGDILSERLPTGGPFGELRKLSPTERSGYLRVNIFGRLLSVNRLVCEAFYGPPPAEHFHASHLDDNSLNNRPQNLAWEAPAQNFARLPRGESHREAKLCNRSVLFIRSAVRGDKPVTIASLARRFGVSESAVRRVVQRKTWRHI